MSDETESTVGPPGDEATLVGVLQRLSADGYDAQLIALESGDLRGSGCDGTSPAEEFEADGFQRLEGASDPDDMMLIVWGSCPACGARGVLTLGYGPNASAADQAVLERLSIDHVEDPGSSEPNT